MEITRFSLLSGFQSVFQEGTPEEIFTYFAPGRINLLGEHSDYNGGKMLPCALTLGTYTAIRKRTDKKIRIYSANYPEDGIKELMLMNIRPFNTGHWLDYAIGAIWSMNAHGKRIPTGFDLYYEGDISRESGLGSSASFVMATIYSLASCFRIPELSRQDMVLIGQDAENSFLDTNIGILSHFVSAMGKKDNAIFFSSSGLHYKYAPLPMSEFGARFVITNSHFRMPNASELLGERQKECREGFRYVSSNLFLKSLGKLTTDQFNSYKDLIPYPNVRKRVRFVVYENKYTIQGFNCLLTKNISRLGDLMNKSYASMRDDFEGSCPEIDCLVKTARTIPGVLGCKMTGTGFGGCTISIVKNEAIDEFITKVGGIYKKETGITPSFFIADVGDGAHELL